MSANFWEDEVYGKSRALNRCPYDKVISFIFRNLPQDKPKSEIKILEVGCGAGNNLLFAAQEGFVVTGIDISATAIDVCKQRFAEAKLSGDLSVGDFAELSFQDGEFDLVIDRSAINCCGLEQAKRAVAEIHRVLKPHGRFFFNGFSDAHSSYGSGKRNADGSWSGITKGAVAGIEHLYFYSADELQSLFAQSWNLLSIKHVEARQQAGDESIEAEWEVIAEKI